MRADELNETIEIAVFDPRTTISKVLSQDKFWFRKDLKWKRLQQICFWLLKKIGAYATDEHLKYERIVVNRRDLVSKICANIEIVSRIHGREPQTLYIGPEKFRELMSAPEIRQMVNFQVWLEKKNGYEPVRVLGLNVCVVPWMEGVLVTP